ncbi:MAG: acyl-CoA dehydrogenase [Candidatus Rokubacteria bacterium]|nr:acyl-CoA dehydrogenase [Candidatus Rokubacteria bacterium]
MDFAFTPDQQLLRQSVRAFLAEEAPPKVVRALMDDPLGYSEPLWGEMAALGWLGLPFAEPYGGAGLGMVELALVLEETGRAAFPSPYFPSVVLAGSTLALAGSPAQKEKLLTGIAGGRVRATLAFLEGGLDWGPGGISMRAERQGSSFVLRGVKRFVPWAHAAEVILVPARTSSGDGPPGISLFLVDRATPGISVSPMTGIDLTTRWAEVFFSEVVVPGDALLGAEGRAWAALESTLQIAAVGAAAEMLGAARRCLTMSTEYAKVREQFGQPIGSFQAIKHKCAEMLLEVENAHSAVYYAAWALDAKAPDAAVAASVAKSYVGDAARRVSGEAIQVHGGIGFTWEYDLHLYFKRAKALEPLYGDQEFHRELIVGHVAS